MAFNPNLKHGDILTNDRLSELFKCSTQGGMRKSNRTNTLVLISGPSIYEDRWKNGVLYYTGEGQKGDQTLTKQNKTLYESTTSGISVFLFEKLGRDSYLFRGKVKLASNPYQEDQSDTRGIMRKVWVFPLQLVELDGGLDIDYRKLRHLISLYVTYLSKNLDYHKQDAIEGYKFKEAKKFQDSLDISSLKAFKATLADAISPTNLVSGSNYFPRRVLLEFLKHDPEFVYQEVKKLLDERRKLASRIDGFREGFEEKRRELIAKGIIEEKYRQTFMTYRFLSYILANYKPEKYIYAKHAEFQHFLDLIGAEKISGKSNGEIYEIYLHYANIAREELKKNKKYLVLHKKLVEETGYSDSSLSWGTQDFIFTLRNYLPFTKASNEYEQLVGLLSQKSQLIFYGPPGTGKTYTARKIAVEFIEGHLRRSENG